MLVTTILGDAGSPDVHSGMHFYFLDAARAIASDTTSINLKYDSTAMQLRRWVFNLTQCIRGIRSGGFQYTADCLEPLWHNVAKSLNGTCVLNFFQLYPPSLLTNEAVTKFFYIDLTLCQLFELYGIGSCLDRRTVEMALALERRGYKAARHIFAMSQFAAGSLTDDYGVPAQNVTVAKPGANISQAVLAIADGEPRAIRRPDEPFTLGFIGKEWERKGLDRLLHVAHILRQDQLDVRVRVIGCPRSKVPASFRSLAFVEWLGFINKRREPMRFVKSLVTCDLGCLLSRADASPMALREFQALGIPTLATDVGGCREMADPSAGVCIHSDATPAEIAAVVAPLVKTPGAYECLRHDSWSHRRECRWSHAASVIIKMACAGNQEDRTATRVVVDASPDARRF